MSTSCSPVFLSGNKLCGSWVNLRTLHIFEHHSTSHYGRSWYWEWLWTWGRTLPHWTVFIWTGIHIRRTAGVRTFESETSSGPASSSGVSKSTENWRYLVVYLWLLHSHGIWGWVCINLVEKTLFEPETTSENNGEICVWLLTPTLSRTQSQLCWGGSFGCLGSTGGMMSPKLLLTVWVTNE